MQVVINEVNLTNVWQETFKRKETGEIVEYYRAMLNKAGEPPMQLAVAKDDLEAVQPFVGCTGKAVINLDAKPNERVRIYLKGFEGK